MVCVPLEKTTAVMPDVEARVLSAGATSGKVERAS